MTLDKVILRTLLLLPLLSLPPVFAAESEQEQFEQQAKAAINEFAITLKSALVAAMQEGGPINAISVCKRVAPEIANTMSAKYALTIGRTSTRIRNPANQADHWETAVLNRFSTQLNAGESFQSLEFIEKVGDNNDAEWRLMKAIPTEQVCLACHGVKIAQPIQSILDKYYPDDKATNFNLGDIRGAFTARKAVNIGQE